MFNERLKSLRERRGLTQQQVADSLKISKSAIANYECGYREPKDNETWIKFSKFFNVTIDYLMGLDDKPFSDSNIDRISNESLNDFTYAMLDETKDLSEEQQAAILAMVKTYKKQLGK